MFQSRIRERFFATLRMTTAKFVCISILCYHNSMSSKGFTLIEILITVVILAVLMSVGIIFYQQAIVQSRDDKRKQDLNQIAQALELYYQVNKTYPGTAGQWRNSSQSNWIPDLIPTFIESLPEDPQDQIGKTYFYHVNDIVECPNLSDGQFYVLMALLEKEDDPDRLEVKDTRYCDGISVTSSLDLTLPTYSQAYILTTP